ncbi:MAG: hypothetical protein EA361_02245 [Bacteroidetes bacterium]|nr:MAG: hypothetical protein EA361_02245 [Bacteroidota bacterium]
MAICIYSCSIKVVIFSRNIKCRTAFGDWLLDIPVILTPKGDAGARVGEGEVNVEVEVEADPSTMLRAGAEAKRSVVPRPQGCGIEVLSARSAKVAQGSQSRVHYSSDDFESSDELNYGDPLRALRFPKQL